MARMTTKHYEVIANGFKNAFSESCQSDIDGVTASKVDDGIMVALECVATALEVENPRFRRELFIDLAIGDRSVNEPLSDDDDGMAF